ncbi:MAG: orotidine-5'-phosphate decarboxylase [Nitrospirae bacterium]|nr:orotidine-5'-phosphate decarboxylase [Nitrospirota bacterium]MCL5421405.1 orotidine-5'-phosphate decarboxylase [Nitrospirota bacterium]
MRNKKGIIFAADIIEKSTLFEITQEVSPYIDAIKVGNIVLYTHGWEIITDLKRLTALPVIADLKLMDIPEIAERIAKSAAEAGVDGIIVCGTAGSDTIAACMRFIKDNMVFVFTEFTHCGGLIKRKMADDYIEIAQILGCAGIQVPGTKENRIRRVRKRVGNDLIIICCGVGSQNYCDRKKVKTSFGSAIAAGADYEIIGRAIYSPTTSVTPREAAMLAKKKILEVLGEKNY